MTLFHLIIKIHDNITIVSQQNVKLLVAGNQWEEIKSKVMWLDLIFLSPLAFVVEKHLRKNGQFTNSCALIICALIKSASVSIVSLIARLLNFKSKLN